MPTLWPFCPKPVVIESLTWLTDVLPTYTREQTRKLLPAPRQTLNLEFAMHFNEYEYAKLLAKSVGSGSWYLPLWHQRQRANVTAGATSASVNTLYSEYKAGGYAVLWSSYTACEVLTVQSKSAGAVQFTTPVVGNYTNAFITPARIAYCPEGMDVQRNVQHIVTLSGEWTAFDTDDYADDALAVTYRGHPAITTPPRIGSGSLSEKVLRSVDTVDSGTALPYYVATLDRMEQSVALAWMLTSAADVWSVRTFLHALYGRNKGAWIPDWTRGLTLTANVAPASTTVRIRAVGLNGVTEAGDLFIKQRNGTCTLLRFTSVAVSGADEVLTLSGTAGASIHTDDVTTMSLLRFARLAQDRVEIQHQYLGHDRQLSSLTVMCREVPIP